MTTQEYVKKAKEYAVSALDEKDERYHYLWLGHALAYMEIAEKQAAADAEALERATQNYAYIDLSTEKERDEFLERFQSNRAQVLKAGKNE